METVQKPAASGKKRRWKLILWSILVVPVILFILYTWLTLSWSFAKGERAGYVQKFSRQGWLVKTWEGELAMVNLPGTAPEKFLFSVRDDAVAERINQALGKRVALMYEEHRGVPSRMFGETDFYVVDVRVLE